MNSYVKGVRSLFFRVYFSVKRHIYTSYSSEDFTSALHSLGIAQGDSLFVMCSADRVYKKTGKQLPVHLVLKDLLEVLGEEGTLMVLGFSAERQKIISGERIFDVKKTPTQCGMFAELVRRKPGTVRSLQPIFSALVYGKKAEAYCASHHLSPYPFGEHSPYYLLTQDGGKYLGIGVGVEAFTPGHMIDDYYKHSYKHAMYVDTPREFQTVGYQNEHVVLRSFIRRTIEGFPAPRHHFKLLNISSSHCTTRSGIYLFSMNMNEYLQAGIKLYAQKKITIWSTGMPRWIGKCDDVYQRVQNLF